MKFMSKPSDFIFIRHPQTLPIGARRDGQVYTKPQTKLLSKQIDLRVPVAGIHEGMVYPTKEGAALKNILPELSKQLGIGIVVEPAMHVLPVNPTVLNDVSIATAMDLLVGQWLALNIYWELGADGVIYLRTR